jgi:hypothetical protein
LRAFDTTGLSEQEARIFNKFLKLIKKDENFPKEGTFDDYQAYLTSTGAPEVVKNAVKTVFKRHATDKHSSKMAEVATDLIDATKKTKDVNF